VGSRQDAGHRDLAADTVIGFVLVTGISILMISVVMLMGAPALEQVQSRQQVDTMVGSYQRLDRGVSTLLSGAPAGTTPSWQVSMADGSLSLDDGGDQIWVFAVNRHQEGGDYEFWFGNYSDGDGKLDVKYSSGPSIPSGQFKMTGVRWDKEEDVDSNSETHTGSSFDPGDDYEITDAVDWELAGHVTQVKLEDQSNEDGNETVAEAWFIDAGAVEWELRRSQIIRLYYQNTGILADIDDGQVLHNTPRLRAPDTDGETDSVFIRIVNLNGTVAVGGRSTSEILLSSEGNHPRVSTSNVTQVQLYPPTSMIEAWERHLTSDITGTAYDWDESDAVFGPNEGAAFFDASGDEMSATLVETKVVMDRTGGS
jgi:hypothetical protein